MVTRLVSCFQSKQKSSDQTPYPFVLFSCEFLARKAFSLKDVLCIRCSVSGHSVEQETPVFKFGRSMQFWFDSLLPTYNFTRIRYVLDFISLKAYALHIIAAGFVLIAITFPWISVSDTSWDDCSEYRSSSLPKLNSCDVLRKLDSSVASPLVYNQVICKTSVSTQFKNPAFSDPLLLKIH